MSVVPAFRGSTEACLKAASHKLIDPFIGWYRYLGYFYCAVKMAISLNYDRVAEPVRWVRGVPSHMQNQTSFVDFAYDLGAGLT